MAKKGGGRNEKTGSKAGSLASKGLRNPGSLTRSQIKTISASNLTQRPNKPGGGKRGK